jgi:hypothetical protein
MIIGIPKKMVIRTPMRSFGEDNIALISTLYAGSDSPGK